LFPFPNIKAFTVLRRKEKVFLAPKFFNTQLKGT
jgi:hypothetical protein